MTRKEYRIGRRLILFRNIFFLLGTGILIAFYFIYDFVLGAAFPALRGLPMIALFLLLEACMIAAGTWWVRRIMDRTLYVVTPEGLEEHLGDHHRTLKWADFEKARYGMTDFSGSCPVRYTVAGRDFHPSVYLADIWKLHQDILQRIRPYADIEEGLETKIGAFL